MVESVSASISRSSFPIPTLHTVIQPMDTLITDIQLTAIQRRTVTVIIRYHISAIVTARTGDTVGVVIIMVIRGATAGMATMGMGADMGMGMGIRMMFDHYLNFESVMRPLS